MGMNFWDFKSKFAKVGTLFPGVKSETGGCIESWVTLFLLSLLVSHSSEDRVRVVNVRFKSFQNTIG